MTGIVISFLFTFLVAALFTRPIKQIVKEAQDIAQEKRERRLEPRPLDEIGMLTDALNTMIEALRKKRMEIQDYARNLERRVQERTADLVAAMEDYRTLVEHVPLIVYRVLRDGTTEFINSYLTDSLGYTIEEAVRDKTFWRKKICGKDLQGGKDMFTTCFEHGEECWVERQVTHKDGRVLTFIDHAIPTRDESGKTKWVDGIMIDISELKRLQERALQTEEIRILGEISARMAHEIRNPLAAAGGFARRLLDSLPKQDPRHKLAQIIMKEVARLEHFLKILLTSIEPFELSLSPVDVNRLLRSMVVKLEGDLKSRKITVKEAFSREFPDIQGDEQRLNQAFQSLLRHAIVSIPEGGELFLSTDHAGDSVSVILRYKVPHLSEDDLEQFFFPHVEAETESTILDLPLSKIIIHRHGGKVDVLQEEGNALTIRIELPIRARR